MRIELLRQGQLDVTFHPGFFSGGTLEHWLHCCCAMLSLKTLIRFLLDMEQLDQSMPSLLFVASLVAHLVVHLNLQSIKVCDLGLCNEKIVTWFPPTAGDVNR